MEDWTMTSSQVFCLRGKREKIRIVKYSFNNHIVWGKHLFLTSLYFGRISNLSI
jgi:hypothetical protein